MQEIGKIAEGCARQSKGKSTVTEPGLAAEPETDTDTQSTTRQDSTAERVSATKRGSGTTQDPTTGSESPTEEDFLTPISSPRTLAYPETNESEDMSTAVASTKDGSECRPSDHLTKKDIATTDSAISTDNGTLQAPAETKENLSLGERPESQLPTPERHKSVTVTAQVA